MNVHIIRTNGKEMKISKNLRARARHIKRHGFSAHLWGGGYSCCFVGAKNYVRNDCANNAAATNFLKREMFHGQRYPFASGKLQADQWTTRDAVATLSVAADIAECEGN